MNCKDPNADVCYAWRNGKGQVTQANGELRFMHLYPKNELESNVELFLGVIFASRTTAR
jgi:hypothetical protein